MLEQTRKALGERRPPPSLLTLKAFMDTVPGSDQCQKIESCVEGYHTQVLLKFERNPSVNLK